MRIVTGFRHPKTEIWNAMIRNLERSAKRIGHSIDVLDFPCSDEWLLKYPDIFQTICWKYKLHAILEDLNEFRDDLVWIDADCLIRRPINFEAVLEGCDMAFTLRDIEERKTASDYPVQDGYLNTGVMLFKHNRCSIDFLERAKDNLLLSIYEQEAINKVILKVNPMAKHDEVIDVMGARVKILNCREYNFIYLDESSTSWESARILHYKGDGRNIYHAHVEKLIEGRL